MESRIPPSRFYFEEDDAGRTRSAGQGQGAEVRRLRVVLVKHLLLQFLVQVHEATHLGKKLFGPVSSDVLHVTHLRSLRLGAVSLREV